MLPAALPRRSFPQTPPPLARHGQARPRRPPGRLPRPLGRRECVRGRAAPAPFARTFPCHFTSPAPHPPPHCAADFELDWTIKNYPHITVDVGDTVTFVWQGPPSHGLALVSEGACPTSNDRLLAEPANTGKFVWKAERKGVFWLACPVPGHCMLPYQMHLKITVGEE
jgi:hypothetical protein